MDKSSHSKNKIEEQQTAVQSVRIYDSIEEQEQIAWLASLSPEQHLMHATALIKRVFDDTLEANTGTDNQLYIKS